MKRILALLILIGLSAIYSRAYSAPSCTSFLQAETEYRTSEQFEIGQHIQGKIPEYRMSRSDVDQRHTLYADIRVGFLGMLKPARLEVSILSDKEADIIITPDNQNNIDAVQKKMEKVYNNLVKDFGNAALTDSLEKPFIEQDPQTGRYTVRMSLNSLNQARVDMLTYLIRRALNLKPLPQNPYWEFESVNLHGDIYHVPERFRSHQTPSAMKNVRNHLASAYARPVNIPPHIKNFFDTTSGFKMILNRGHWIIESLHEAQYTGPKTLMLLANPDGTVEVLDETPYRTQNPIKYAENLHSYILMRRFKSVEISDDNRITFQLTDLLTFYNELTESEFTLIGPILNPNVFPFVEDRRNL